jgi:uncharacterized protein YaiL (DUF2058 family)
MGSSLQEQLLQAGLVTKAKANDTRKQKARKAKRAKKPAAGAQPTSPAKPVDPEKAARDRELDRKRQEARQQRALAAQITDLVRHHRHPRNTEDADQPFHFESKGKVKRIYVNADTRERIAAGKLVIVNCNGVFELVPPDIAEKVRARNPSLVVDLPGEKTPSEDDPYADYTVPDDLMW